MKLNKEGMAVTKKYLRISDLAKVTGVPRSTIQYYLRENLLHPPFKTGKTMAYYDQGHVEQLEKIIHLRKEQGLPINFIKKEIQKSFYVNQKPFSNANNGNRKAASKVRDYRRQEIIAAAVKVFSKRGYYRTTIQDIVQIAGISISTFYLYFENKRELFVNVVDDVIRTIIEDSQQAIQKEDDPERKLIVRGEMFHEHYLRYNEIISQVRAEMAGDDRWPHEKIKQIYKDLTEPVIGELQQLIDEKIVRPMDKELMAHALTGLIETMCLRLTFDDEFSIKDMMEFLRDFIFNGIRNPA